MSDKKIDSKRKMISGASAVALVALTLVGAVLANVIASQFFFRLDLTENKIYTLSPASKAAVQSLDEALEVKVYLSPDMPVPFHNLSTNLSDLLSEYAIASGGKLTFQIRHPEENEAVEAEATKYGLEKVAIGQQTETEISLRAVYKGIVFVLGDETEVINDLHTTGRSEYDNFEYEFTKAILNIQRPEPLRVGFLVGFGGPAGYPHFVDNLAPIFEQFYGRLIEVVTVDLSREDKIPDNVSALVILNIDQPVGTGARFAIDQFLQRGGNVGWYQSAAVFDFESQPVGGQPVRKAANLNINELFGHYGLEHRGDVVIDRERSLSYTMVMTQQGLARVSHPGTFSLTDIDASLPFARDFGTLAMPVPSSIAIRPNARENANLEVFEVIKTAASAVRRPQAPLVVGYEEFMEVSRDEQRGPFVVAAALQGRFPSYYEDNPLPPGITEADLVADVGEGRLLIVGSGEFFQPMPQAGFDERLANLGAQFLLNSIEWLVQDSAMAQIRGKAMPRLMGQVPRDLQRSIQFVNIAFVPALFAAIGTLMMIRRRKRKEKIRL